MKNWMIRSYLEVEEENLEEYLDQVKQNLDKGEFRFVVLMDQVESRLKDLILFMNHNSAFNIYAVELDYYTFDGYHLSIPKLYGAEVKKSVSRTTSGRRKWDEESFFEDLKEKVDESIYFKIERLYENTKNLGEISFGTGVVDGSITLRVKSKNDINVSVYTIWSNGSARLFSGSGIDPLEKRRNLVESYIQDLREENPKLPPYDKKTWKVNLGDVDADQIDDFIQFYRDVVKEINKINLE